LLKLKVEINCKEHFTLLGYKNMKYGVANEWFAGDCELTTFDFDELCCVQSWELDSIRKNLLDIELINARKNQYE
jgi:hypothetical protein